MITAEELFQIFKKNDLTFFTGVPDSTFKAWMSFLQDNNELLTNRIAAIERDSIAIAAGYYAATSKIPVVYMQNSGLGNTVNPITSLTDPEVYEIPLLLMVGWRGEPELKDEPQHKKMGKITLELLDLLGIKYSILPFEKEEAEKIISEAKKYIEENNKAYALVIKKKTITDYSLKNKQEQDYELLREKAIKTIINNLDDEIIISTTGKTSRELFEYREETKFGHQNDFLMVGSMGCASSMAMEIALQKENKRIIILDGDGAMIMSMGALSTIGHYSPKNLLHILFDNEAHESTGGQPTLSPNIDFEKLALANNYKEATTANNKKELEEKLTKLKTKEGPNLLIIKVKKGSRKDLGRPTTTPIQNKKDFMKKLRE